MDISAIISKDNSPLNYGPGGRGQPAHQYPTRQGSFHQTGSDYSTHSVAPPSRAMSHSALGLTQANGLSTHGRTYQHPLPKTVEFQLKLSDRNRARLPMRVQIHATDRPESILDSVQRFWGLYDGRGISLEDEGGNTLIAQYENFVHNCKVFVRVFPAVGDQADPRGFPAPPHLQTSFTRPQLGEPFQMPPPQSVSRPGSRSTKKREASPRPYNRSSSAMNPARSPHGDDDNCDSDGGSVSSSRRARSELPSTEISLENIVEGGRRARMAKFESSELPLFVPPQQPMTTSISSMSPQRRFTNGAGNMQSPSHFNNQRTFSYAHNIPALSPQSYGYNGIPTPNTGSISSAMANGYATSSNGHQVRVNRPTARFSGSGVPAFFPTPDPTNGSAISDEDVAWQLLRLGEPSNISSRGRTSTSTLDDAFSGKAEAASTGNVSEDENTRLPRMVPRKQGDGSGPAKKKQKQSASKSYAVEYTSSEEYEDNKDASFKGESDELGPDVFGSGYDRNKPKSTKSLSRRGSVSSRGKPAGTKGKSKVAASKMSPSPFAQPAAARKTSIASINLPQHPDDDDEDLSTKPRCQRCRKSKKGCDRQRPCQRCKDAGIGIEGCISEDEGNGRKGRFGRHMGVPVATNGADGMPEYEHSVAGSTHAHNNAMTTGSDAGKKRKR